METMDNRGYRGNRWKKRRKLVEIGGQRVENVWKIGGKSVQNHATLSFNLLCLCKRDGHPLCCRTLTGPYYEEITKLTDKRQTVHVELRSTDGSQYYQNWGQVDRNPYFVSDTLLYLHPDFPDFPDFPPIFHLFSPIFPNLP